MKTLEVTLYNFSELEECIKEKLIDKQRQVNAEHMDFDWVLDHWKEVCERAGFISPKFDYAIGGGQSDYFNMQFSYIEESVLKEIFFEVLGKESYLIFDTIINNSDCIQSNFYSKHYSRNQVEISTNTSNTHINIESFLDKLSDRLTDLFHDVCYKCVKIAEDEIDYSYSEEYAIERLEEDGEIYLKDGQIYNI